MGGGRGVGKREGIAAVASYPVISLKGATLKLAVLKQSDKITACPKKVPLNTSVLGTLGLTLEIKEVLENQRKNTLVLSGQDRKRERKEGGSAGAREGGEGRKGGLP